ncbi:SWIM zinc finger family protein [Corallococcus macrosporus]|uniref:SWIM zinc finger domain-containing protein n=1 Tax=Myxococcus fulvus (strain ATCC BAA-855 / HW-1) TaxID=483219 RepID=F8CL10_MYXFH|nr:SWIM zinc finger family protein [Corallococcus macrosporus]AEI63923.1 SWIM zinc finger domain-containing protein [Corallococcus macrosporus]
MSDRDFWGWPSTPKRPPPAHGIKMKKAGTTWWGQRWLEALERVLGGDSGRLSRGRTYARAGRTHDLVIQRGEVTARVTGSRPKPYAISLTLKRLDDGVWEKAIAGMAGRAQYAAELLAGAMPQAIDEVFLAAGGSLFPRSRGELMTECSCPDWGDPCKHVAATHYVLGEALDHDPFLLFELRGRTKEQVLSALRAARGAGSDGEGATRRGAAKRRRAADAPAIPSVKPGKLTRAGYDAPREPLPALGFTFEVPSASGAVLRQLGAPASWSANITPGEVLAPPVRAAAERARRIALEEPGAADAPATAPRRRSRAKRKGADE